MKTLEESRKTINDIDKQLMKLFEQRMEVVVEVAKYKQINNLAIFQADREKQVIENNLNLLENESLIPYATTFLNSLMDVSKNYQCSQLEITINELSNNLPKLKYGLIGEKICYSLSPRIHNSVFENQCIDAEYTLYQVQPHNAYKIIESLKTLGINGANVTMPYKKAVIAQLDEISPEAKKIDSVNTICFKDGKAIGYNTDYYGIGAMLDHSEIEVTDKDFYILGAGGSCKSVIWYLKDHGAKNVTIVSRNVERAKSELDNLEIDIIDYEELNKVEKAYGIVNTTPCGMYPNIDSMAIDKEKLKCFEVAIDLIYTPEETLFLKHASDYGLKTASGLYMLVAQALKSQEIWHNCIFDKSLEEPIYNKLSKYIKLTKKSMFLVGFMGAGKTTVGKLLAAKLGMPFKDCDYYIEEKYNMTISEIFKEHGEEYFREIEAKALIELEKGEPSIIATGGGAVTYPESYELLQNQKCIYLMYDLKTLHDRIKDDTRRPLVIVNTVEQLRDKLKIRDPLYLQVSDLTIPCSNLSVQDIIRDILRNEGVE